MLGVDGVAISGGRAYVTLQADGSSAAAKACCQTEKPTLWRFGCVDTLVGGSVGTALLRMPRPSVKVSEGGAGQ